MPERNPAAVKTRGGKLKKVINVNPTYPRGKARKGEGKNHGKKEGRVTFRGGLPLYVNYPKGQERGKEGVLPYIHPIREGGESSYKGGPVYGGKGVFRHLL